MCTLLSTQSSCHPISLLLQVVLLPIDLVTATSPRRLDPYGRVLERVLSTTLQPSTGDLTNTNTNTAHKQHPLINVMIVFN
jgi:hypothetical protein